MSSGSLSSKVINLCGLFRAVPFCLNVHISKCLMIIESPSCSVEKSDSLVESHIFSLAPDSVPGLQLLHTMRTI